MSIRRCASNDEIDQKFRNVKQDHYFELLAASSSHFKINSFVRCEIEKEIYSEIETENHSFDKTHDNFTFESVACKDFLQKQIKTSQISDFAAENRSESSDIAIDHPHASDITEILSLEATTPNPREWISLHKTDKASVLCKLLSPKGLMLCRTLVNLPKSPGKYMKIIRSIKKSAGAMRDVKILEVKPYYEILSFKMMPYAGISAREFICRRI